MSYVINKTDGNVLVTLLDGTTNTDTGLTLIGRNYTSYGEIQNENFVRLLENFADNIPPGQSVGFTPLVGQLWYDTTNKRLRVYNALGQWDNVSEQTSGTTAPTSAKAGDQWYDTTNAQFKIYTGSTWQLIGPGYTAGQGKSGAIVETIVDSANISHTVVNTYTNNHLVSITSYDPQFTVSTPISGITTINPGITTANGYAFTGTASNSITVGGISPTEFPRTTQNTVFTKDLGVNGNIVLTNANLFYSGSNFIIQNKAFGGNVDFYINGSPGNVRALSINGTTGFVSVPFSPQLNDHVSTKGYVDQEVGALVNDIQVLDNQLTLEINQLRSDYFANIAVVVSNTNANLNSAVNTINANVATLEGELTSNVAAINANLFTLSSAITTINNTLPSLAPIANPHFLGIPTTATAPQGTNTTQLSTTEYVDRQAGLLTTDYVARVLSASQQAANNLAAAIAPLAPLASPTFTGSPNSTTPTIGDNSTKIATTAFVTAAIASQKFVYTVSPNPPSGGNDGDFWFQVG